MSDEWTVRECDLHAMVCALRQRAQHVERERDEALALAVRARTAANTARALLREVREACVSKDNNFTAIPQPLLARLDAALKAQP